MVLSLMENISTHSTLHTNSVIDQANRGRRQSNNGIKTVTYGSG